MSKLYFNYDELSKNVIENIILIINKLNFSINKIDSLNLPYSFLKKQEVMKIRNQLLKDKTSLQNIIDKINENNRIYNKRHNEILYEIGKIPVLKVDERKGISQ